MKKTVFFLIALLLASETFSCGLKELLYGVWRSYNRAEKSTKEIGLPKSETCHLIPQPREHPIFTGGLDEPYKWATYKEASNDEFSFEVAGAEIKSKSKKPFNSMAGIGTNEKKDQ